MPFRSFETKSVVSEPAHTWKCFGLSPKFLKARKEFISSKTQTQTHQLQGSEEHPDEKIIVHKTLCECPVSSQSSII